MIFDIFLSLSLFSFNKTMNYSSRYRSKFDPNQKEISKIYTDRDFPVTRIR